VSPLSGAARQTGRTRLARSARGHTVFCLRPRQASDDRRKARDAGSRHPHRRDAAGRTRTIPNQGRGDGVLLVSWIAEYVVGRDEGSSDRFDVELGHIFGATSPPLQLPVATNSEADEGQARSFVDSQGMAV